MTEIWQILKAYYQPADDETYWQILISALDDLGRRYHADDNPLVRELTLAILEGLEARHDP